MSLKILKNTQKKIWISTTGYRILFEFLSILQVPRTIDEIIEIIKNNSYISKEISKDTVRFDINTLRIAGCNITKPTRANGYTYFVVSHPFNLNISKEELDVLVDFREELASKFSPDEVFIINDLYEKIISLTFCNEQIQYIKDTALLTDVNRSILQELFKLVNKKIQIKYKSPKYGEEDIYIIPLKFFYENQKAYVSAYNYKYNCNSYFNISKILKINSVSMLSQTVPLQSFKVVYEIINEALNDFSLKDNEVIIEQNSEKIVVEAQVENEFMFTQRLLLFGRNFKIISPDFYRETLINKIKLIQKRYINEKN